jgi:hypothetical protein
VIVASLIGAAALVWVSSLVFANGVLKRQAIIEKDPRLDLLQKTHDQYLHVGMYSSAVEVKKEIVAIMGEQR